MPAPGEGPEAPLDPVQLGTCDLVVTTVGCTGLGRRDQLGPQPEVVSMASAVTERTIMAAGVEGTRAEDPHDGDMGQVQPGGGPGRLDLPENWSRNTHLQEEKTKGPRPWGLRECEGLKGVTSG